MALAKYVVVNPALKLRAFAGLWFALQQDGCVLVSSEDSAYTPYLKCVCPGCPASEIAAGGYEVVSVW